MCMLPMPVQDSRQRMKQRRDGTDAKRHLHSSLKRRLHCMLQSDLIKFAYKSGISWPEHDGEQPDWSSLLVWWSECTLQASGHDAKASGELTLVCCRS